MSLPSHDHSLYLISLCFCLLNRSALRPHITELTLITAVQDPDFTHTRIIPVPLGLKPWVWGGVVSPPQASQSPRQCDRYLNWSLVYQLTKFPSFSLGHSAVGSPPPRLPRSCPHLKSVAFVGHLSSGQYSVDKTKFCLATQGMMVAALTPGWQSRALCRYPTEASSLHPASLSTEGLRMPDCPAVIQRHSW